MRAAHEMQIQIIPLLRSLHTLSCEHGEGWVVPESSLNVLWNEKEKAASASLQLACFDGLLRSVLVVAAAAGTLGKPMSQQEGENNSLCN